MRLHSAATAPGAAHDYTVRVYYEDTDAGGIVYHASYLRFAERARTEALRELGVPHAALVEAGFIFVVRRVELRYLRPARLDDLISVRTEVMALGGATARLRQGFRSAAGDLAMLEVELACVRADDGRPARIPDRWRVAMAGAAAVQVPDDRGIGGSERRESN